MINSNLLVSDSRKPYHSKGSSMSFLDVFSGCFSFSCSSRFILRSLFGAALLFAFAQPLTVHAQNTDLLQLLEEEDAGAGADTDAGVETDAGADNGGSVFPVPVLEEVNEAGGSIAAPSASNMASPEDVTQVESLTDNSGSSGAESIEIPSISATEASDDDVDLFFDADSLVPTGEMGSKSGPRKVDPVLEPASKLIIVKKNASPDSKSAQLVAAQRAMKLGRYESALDIYDMLYAKNKRDPRILMGRAVALQRLGRFDAAISSYEELAAIDSKNVEAQVNMLGLLGTKYPSVALRRLLDLRDEYPHHVGIVSQIGVMQAQLGSLQEAMRYLGIAASMEPHNPSHVYNMAVISDRAGVKKQAVRYYEQALELDSVYGRSQTLPRESIYERLANIR